MSAANDISLLMATITPAMRLGTKTFWLKFILEGLNVHLASYAVENRKRLS